MSMSSTINVHRPEVEAGELGVYRSESSGDLTITLASNSSLRVTMFATDEQWDAIVDRVAAFRRSEHYVANNFHAVIRETDILDTERETLSQRFACENCGDVIEVIDGIPGETLCHPCWTRNGMRD